MKKKRGFIKTFLLVILVLYSGINLYNYKINLNIYSKPPSDKWGKGKYIDTLKPNINCRIISEDKNYILAINDKETIKIFKINNLGDVLLKKTIKIETDILNDLTIMKLKNNKFYLQWNSLTLDGAIVKSVFLDKNFNEISKRTEEKLQCSCKMDEGIMIFGYKDKIEVRDLNDNKKYFIKANQPQFLNGKKGKGNDYFIIYRDKDFNIVKVKYTKGKISEPVNVFKLIERTKRTTEAMDIVVNDEMAYLILQESQYKEPINSFGSFNLYTNKSNEFKEIKLDGITQLSNIVSYKQEDNKIWFLGNGNRITDFNGAYDDIVEFYIDENKAVFTNAVSKFKSIENFQNGLNDIVVYGEYNAEKDEYDLKFTSCDKEFKNKNNQIKARERKDAFLATLEADAYGTCMILILGAKWLLSSLVVVSCFSIIQHKFKEENLIKIFLGLIGSIIIFKIINIHSVVYSKNWLKIPWPLNNIVIGILMCIFISFIIYGFSYVSYKRYKERSFISAISPYLVVDMILTFTLYVQYIL